MQISGYGAVQGPQFNAQIANQRAQTTPFESQIADQVSLSSAGSKRTSPAAAPSQSGVLSGSEKSFFNSSFGVNLFASESASSRPVVSKQGASVLNTQEINYFENTLGAPKTNYGRTGAYGQSPAQTGSSLNRSA